MRSVTIVICFLLATLSFAQTNIPALEKQVTLTIYNEPVDEVLQKITTQTGVKFSYNPASVKVQKKVSFSVSKKPIRSVLKLCFDETIQVKQNGNYIILTYKPPKTTSAKEPVKEVKINGYIYATDGSTIGAASVYNTENLLATISNEYGYYTLTVPANRFPLTLKVAKENFPDTSINIKQAEANLDIVLASSPKPEAIPTIEKDSIQNTDTLPLAIVDTSTVPPIDSTVAKKPISTFIQNLVLSENLKSSIRNIKDTAFRKTQVSLIPYVSTNKLLAGNTVNDYSFNILVGYSQGVNCMEIGGLMNVDRGDVKFMQAAGMINAVGGNVTGGQIAGIGNITKGRSEGMVGAGVFNLGTHMHGIQMAGVLNVNLSIPDSLKNSSIADFFQDTVKGIQVAGVANINAGYTEGVRIAGTLNLGQDNKGVQVAGIMNGNWGKSTGVNAAWILNYIDDTLTGYNISGIANMNKKYVDGFQIAGIINIIDGDLKGTQVTSLVNIARHVEGTQIALLNFSDSARGLPIGLISYVKTGYHKLEFFGDDMISTQLAFRTGLPKFHNIFSVGIDLTKKYDGLWNFGYGLGSTFPLSSKWYFTGDLMAQIIMQRNKVEYAPLLGNLFAGIERQFHKQFSLAIGPVLHTMITFGTQNTYTDLASRLVPYSISNTTFANGNVLNAWVGGKISLRFL